MTNCVIEWVTWSKSNGFWRNTDNAMSSTLAAKRPKTAGNHSKINDMRLRLQDVIAETDEGMLEPLLEALQPLDMEILKPPATGLIMMNVDTGTFSFHLGEVLVTEAQVSCSGITGYGCCMGERFNGALVLACLDALAQTEISIPADAISGAINQICQQVFRQRKADAQMAAVTRVDFHSMAEE
jgi:phosphonate C-P lyase system protein PhnG